MQKEKVKQAIKDYILRKGAKNGRKKQTDGNDVDGTSKPTTQRNPARKKTK